MHVGKLLATCKAGEHWRAGGFGSLDEFMLDLRERYKRGRTQLWSYMTVAEKLLPILDATTLEEIGISKAMELKRGLKKADGKSLPETIIEAARKQATTAKEVRALVAQAFNLSPDDKGSWFDFDGCFMTPEERQEFKQAVKITMMLLEIKKDVPEHIARKEIFMAWAREFKATHEPEVFGPVTTVNTPAVLMLPPNSVTPESVNTGCAACHEPMDINTQELVCFDTFWYHGTCAPSVASMEFTAADVEV
jgi:hypothetical protein